MSNYILAIDQGTSSSRAFIVNLQGEILGTAHQEIPMIYPKPGWVEQDPNHIWTSVLNVIQKSIHASGITFEEIRSIGITNQRETIVLWDKVTGESFCHAINWQDRRTKEICETLKTELKDYIFQNTGLVIDPYFSATKIKWIFDQYPELKEKAAKGSLLIGTIDSYLIFKLTEGKSHVTDVTNASRTMLYNLYTQEWDSTLLQHFEIPYEILPKIKPCLDNYGEATVLSKKPIPIVAVAGDQQAALIGHSAFEDLDAKFTFGTGCFVLVNTGKKRIHSQHQLITTQAYHIGQQQAFALEGSVFMAGSLVQWLRDELKIFEKSTMTSTMAAESTDENLLFVPSFTGMGAPHWVPSAKGALFGLMRSTNKNDIVKAALEGILFQTLDLIHALNADLPRPIRCINIDGGMSKNDWFCQKLSDYSNCEVVRPLEIESSVMGVAWLASMAQKDNLEVPSNLRNNFTKQEKCFRPNYKTTLQKKYKQWQKAVVCVKQFSE